MVPCPKNPPVQSSAHRPGGLAGQDSACTPAETSARAQNVKPNQAEATLARRHLRQLQARQAWSFNVLWVRLRVKVSLQSCIEQVSVIAAVNFQVGLYQATYEYLIDIDVILNRRLLYHHGGMHRSRVEMGRPTETSNLAMKAGLFSKGKGKEGALEKLISRSSWFVSAMEEDAVTAQPTLSSTASVGQRRSLRTEVRPELLRGVPLHVALSNWGRHWRAPDQGMFNVNPKNYQLSRPTKAYDAFLSHDWASSRWLKFVSLLMIFNSGPAFAISFLVSVLVGTLRAYRVIPDQAWTLSVIYVVYFTIFLFWQRIRAILCRPLVVFLDKLCVAQHDEDLKQEGIQSLGAFLLSSRELVVLLSPQYLSLGQSQGSFLFFVLWVSQHSKT